MYMSVSDYVDFILQFELNLLCGTLFILIINNL